MKSNLTDVYVEVRHETPSAILVSEDGEKQVWLPKSQVEIEYDKDDLHATVTMPEWLAMEKGFI